MDRAVQLPWITQARMRMEGSCTIIPVLWGLPGSEVQHAPAQYGKSLFYNPPVIEELNRLLVLSMLPHA
jgi:hypothetical protein